jgi:protein phosphatase
LATPLHSIEYASLTDVGIRRSHNQDACATQPAPDDAVFLSHGHVFIVADGMGGHAVGEKASAKAIRDIPLTYQKYVASEGPRAAIRRAITEANAAIHQIGQNNPEFKGLGTTGSALFIRREGAWVGHVGDSRVYRIRPGKVQQLTFDHSWVWEIARRQGVDPDDLGDFKRNVIIRSLGPEADVEVDIEGPHPLEAGDAFLLCSDGLTNHVKPDEIGAAVAVFGAKEACEFLVALANLRGGSDNITTLVARVSDGGTDPGRPRKPGGLAGLWAKWTKRVPWPLTALGAGAFFVVLSILMRFEGIPGATVLFALAALATIAGLIGLVVQMKNKVEEGSDPDEDAERPLQVYKEYAFALGPDLSHRFAEDEALAVKAADEAKVEYDREAYTMFAEHAARDAKAGDWPAAFRARCRALLTVALPLNRSHRKEEAFKPNWTTPNRSAPG